MVTILFTLTVLSALRRSVEMDGYSKDSVMYTHLLNMLAAKIKGKNVAAIVIQDDVEGTDIIDAEVFEVLESIDAEVLAKQQKLDKGKGKISEANIFTSKKRKPLQRGNGITIRENENPLHTDTDPFDSEDHTQSESDCSEKSFDYLSDCDDEVIELRKRRFEYKYTNQEDNNDTILETDKEECTQSLKFEDVLNNDVVLTPLVKEHERNMQSLLKKLKGIHMGITDPFAIV
nr:pentatricopeptide repeat-containing protein [Tanacetum cinerariifolium]